MPTIFSRVSLSILLVLFSFLLSAQVLLDIREPQQVYNRAILFLQNQQYGLAQEEFERVLKLSKGKSFLQIEEASKYYILECAYEQQQFNTERLILKYIASYPHGTYCNDAYHLLGKFYYQLKNYEKALDALEKFHSYNLAKSDFQEYTFKKAYSLFYIKDFERAAPLFALLKDSESKYATAATYYYAHIAYEQKMFSVALKHFEKLRNDDVFSRVVPYYVIHIFHYQKNYDKVIEEGEKMIEDVSGKRLAEISRIISEAYYHKEDYVKALPYIEKFTATTSLLTRSDKYIAGYVYYRNKGFERAAEMFEQIVVGNDSLAQNAYYYLADAFLQQGNKRSAGNAFLQASKMDFFPELKEDAMFSYAKLMFELNLSPFNDAIDALLTYLKEYPKSRRRDEAHKCLMQAYLMSKNYKEALVALQSIEKPDAEALSALQKVAYFRAIELFQNQQYEETLSLFELSIKFGTYHPSIMAQAIYWKGEAMYRLKRFEEAKDLFSEFVLSAGSVPTKEFRLAHYNLGYSFFHLKHYDEAIIWFRKYLSFADAINYPLLCDSHNRIADGNFMQKRYNEAVNSYNVVRKMKSLDADYAAYQAGLCYGLLGALHKKINLMEEVINFKPMSPYSDQALYEKGRSYVQLSEYQMAVAEFQTLLDTFPRSALVAKTLLELGFIAVNQQNNPQGLVRYKRVVSEFAGTAEARTALLGVKNIYMDMDDVDGYFKYIATLKHVVSSSSERDSLSFSVAEKAYLEENYEKARGLLGKYLAEFSNGAFAVDVHFYLADCFYLANDYDAALPHLSHILGLPKGNYTELALQKAIHIANSKEDYKQALGYYEQLKEVASTRIVQIEALFGLVRSNFFLNNYTAVIDNAMQVLVADNVPDEMQREARFKQAKSYEVQNDTLEAIELYKELAVDPITQEGAEAYYIVIKHEFNAENLERAEKAILDFSKTGTPHQYWLAKSFIILGDIYVKRGDAFQAKATYESILDGYKDEADGVVQEVSKKVQELLAVEQVKEIEAQSQETMAPVVIEENE
ncbi:MAG: tetratricopeptide repeat protein [Bacteroidales bacterium]